MAAAKSQNQSSRDRDNVTLFLYRLDNVELALKDLTSKVDRQDNIKKADLMELRDTIVGRVNDVQTNLQKQINSLANDKASSQELKDFKKQVSAIGVFLCALGVALFSYMLTRIK